MHRYSRRPAPRRLITIIFTAAATLIAACSPDKMTAPQLSAPMAPVIPAALNKLKDSLKALGQQVLIAEGLRWETQLVQPISASEMITHKKGGRIEIKELGLKIDIPKHAIQGDSVRITVTAVPGHVVAYDFQPHGVRFDAPLEFEQSLKNTNWEKKDIKTTLWGAYFADPGQLDQTSDLAVINELIETRVLGNKVRFDIWHFSGYMVSTGRRGSSTDVAR